MSEVPEKPRYRVPARRVADGLQNFEARLGLGTDNQMSATRYGFNPITRNRIELEAMYRGSWIVRQAVGTVSDDMTRSGIEIQGKIDPDHISKIHIGLRRKRIWKSLGNVSRWGRLYGGAIGVFLIDGQDLSKPLRVETVGKGQFRGILVLDRWQIQPSMVNFVEEVGPDFGLPEYYQIVADSYALPRGSIHHSRVFRMEGDDLPFWQRQTEMGWGMSVVEALYDRLVAFDSTTAGIAQMVHRAHLRTLKMKDLRRNIALGGKPYEAQLAQVDLIRRYQSLEGLTLLDADDDFETYSYTFAGLPDVLLQMGQQLSGALQIPLVRLFGQSPAGMNSTGESDLRTYYDGINLEQETQLRDPVGRILDLEHRSQLGVAPPQDFDFAFNPLWGMSAKEKAEVATAQAAAVTQVEYSGIVKKSTALKELRQGARTTGMWSNITDAEIEAAEAEEADAPAPLPNIPSLEEEPETGEALKISKADEPSEGVALAVSAPTPTGSPPDLSARIRRATTLSTRAA